MKEDATEKYLHGYSQEEQDRLYEQARFLEPMVYEKIDLSKASKLLEIGCGVGAQTRILLDRFPNVSVTCIDTSEAQLGRAREFLKSDIATRKVSLLQTDGGSLPFPNDSFDSAFICWLLEHVPSPTKILEEAYRVLSPGGVLYCTEVLNSSLYLHPYSPATLQYWMNFNDHQWTMGGDPFVGAKLGNYLKMTGFQNIETRSINFHLDHRAPKLRAQMIDYWIRLLLSGTASLLAAGKTNEKEIAEMQSELKRLKAEPDSVFFYTSIQARTSVQ